jgi:hypothetical protein
MAKTIPNFGSVYGVSSGPQSDVSIDNQFQVRLHPINVSAYRRNQRGEFQAVVFNVTPDFVENRNVNYKTMEPVHMPGQIYVYGSSSSRTFQLSNVRLISRTIDEATENMNILNALRGWTMPYFGNSSPTDLVNTTTEKGQNSPPRGSVQDGRLQWNNPTRKPEKPRKGGSGMLGAPPDVLALTAYSNTSTGYSGLRKEIPTHIWRVPVVIQTLSIPFPSDVDYIPTKDGQPMPLIMTIDIQLVEAQSPRNLQQFRLQDYRRGTMLGF